MDTPVLSASPEEALSTPELLSRQLNPRSESPDFAVELRRRPKYVPGCGPALQPLRLLPSATSTARIIERILLPSPGPAADGRPLPRRMTYIVGWHDLPAASLLVPAMQILDYVSPATLEDWEDDLEAEMEMGRNPKRNGAETKDISRIKGRRPPHTEIEQAVAVEPVSEPVSPPKKSSMSLSTPQKRKLADFAGLSDDEDDDDDGSANGFDRELFDADGRAAASTSASSSGKNVGSDKNAADDDDDYDDDDDDDDGNSTSTDSAVKSGQGTHIIIKKITPVPYPPYVGKLLLQKTDPTSGDTKPLSIVRLGSENGDSLYLNQDNDGSVEMETASDRLTGRNLSDDTEVPSQARSQLGGRRRRASTTRTSESLSATAPPTPSQGQKRRRRSPPEPPAAKNDAAADEEPSWEVERLENMVRYEVEGRGLVRYFLVRWAGDWPPEQNPTWEPEENIPKNLARQYLKMSKGRRAKLAEQSRKLKPKQALGVARIHRQLTSVSDTSADDDDNDDGDGSRDAPDTVRRDKVSRVGARRDSHNDVLAVNRVDHQAASKLRKETPVPLPRIVFGVF